MLRCSSMTKFLFLTDPHPQETGIIRAMETGNTSPSLSFSPSSLWPPSAAPPPPFLSLSLCFSLSPPVSLSLPPHLCHLRCAFICTDYQVQGLKSVAWNDSRNGYQSGFTGNEDVACARLCSFIFSRKYWLYLADRNLKKNKTQWLPQKVQFP